LLDAFSDHAAKDAMKMERGKTGKRGEFIQRIRHLQPRFHCAQCVLKTLLVRLHGALFHTWVV
jgi:hypothetical protein